MGELLCAGVTHHPGFLGPDNEIASLLRKTLGSPRVPEKLKDVHNWPIGMQQEWSDDQGARAAKEHRRRIWQSFREVRNRIEQFNPDFIVIWGDDQYEQFREECVPPFNVFIFDRLECQPYLLDSSLNPAEKNYWTEPVSKTFAFRGHPGGSSYLVQRLIEHDFDVAYSYKVRDGQPLPHSFLNTALYLDCDRSGFDYPIVPFHVNCYGSTVIRSRGSLNHLFTEQEARFDPISPTAKRCFDLGMKTAQILKGKPLARRVDRLVELVTRVPDREDRVNSSDMEADRRYFEHLKAGRYREFRDMALSDIEASGQQEVLNWCCLAGALDALKAKSPDYIDFVESYIFNSNKVMLAYPPL